MVELLESDKIKLKILKILSNGNVYSFYHLSKLLQTNYNIVKVIKVEKNESASGIPVYRVKITEKGLELIKNLNIPHK